MYHYTNSLMIAWELASRDEHIPTPEPSEGEEPIWIGAQEGEKTVVVGEETKEYIYSDELKPVNLEAVR